MRAGYLMNYQHEVASKALARLVAAFCSGSRRAADLAAVRERDRLVHLLLPIKNSVQQTRFLQATQKFASDGTYLGPSGVAERFL